MKVVRVYPWVLQAEIRCQMSNVEGEFLLYCVKRAASRGS